jgi:hypothetical protein
MTLPRLCRVHLWIWAARKTFLTNPVGQRLGPVQHGQQTTIGRQASGGEFSQRAGHDRLVRPLARLDGNPQAAVDPEDVAQPVLLANKSASGNVNLI